VRPEGLGNLYSGWLHPVARVTSNRNYYTIFITLLYLQFIHNILSIPIVLKFKFNFILFLIYGIDHQSVSIFNN
jgi:hypothetical protein